MRESDYCVMARLLIIKDYTLRINDNKYIISEPPSENIAYKTYDLHIRPNTGFYVETPDNRSGEYKLFLFLADENKKIIQVPENKLDIAKRVFETLVENKLDFTCENYTTVRDNSFTDNISHTFIGQPFSEKTFSQVETWDNGSFNTLSVLKEWQELMESSNIPEKIAEGFLTKHQLKSRDILTNARDVE